MALISAFPIEEVHKLGYQHWKAIVQDWAAEGGTNAERQLIINYPIAGAQIAAASGAGEVKIRFSQPFRPYEQAIGEEPLDQPQIDEDEIYIKRGKPYFWRTPAPVIISSPYFYDETYSTAFGASTNGGTRFGLNLYGHNANLWNRVNLELNVFFDYSPPVITEPDYYYFAPPAAWPILTDTQLYLVQFYPMWQFSRATFNVRLTSTVAGGDPVAIYLSYITQLDTLEYSLLSTPLIINPENAQPRRVIHADIPPNTYFVGAYAQRLSTNNIQDPRVQVTVRADL